MSIRNIEVIVDNIENNPHCFHGPCLLFKRAHGKTREYFACSACRDRKDCNFYLPISNKVPSTASGSFWRTELNKVILSIKKSKPYKKYIEILEDLKNDGSCSYSIQKNLKQILENEDKKNSNDPTSKQIGYCYNCSCLFKSYETLNHTDCKVILNLTYHQLTHPTEILIPQVDSKTHAQYFFSKSSVVDILSILKKIKVSKVLCIGTPRIHEYITHDLKGEIKSILLDLDKRYFSFYSQNQFIWYNMFNNYIFDTRQQIILNKFLKSGKIVVLIDPPFGGRVEPLANTLKMLNKTFIDARGNDNKGKLSLGTFWFFPYFMEQHIKASLPDFKMSDYKVNYDNHTSFTNEGNKKRKLGSPVRIFTNISLSQLDLNGMPGYKFCNICGHWVANENKHCNKCNSCTSKDGRTYFHCSKCLKCVKSSYVHCETCSRCALPSHVCHQFQPYSNCYKCHEPGHKKHECPNSESKKRKSDFGKLGIRKNKRKKLI